MTDEGLDCREVSEQFMVLKKGIRQLLGSFRWMHKIARRMVS